MTDGPMTTHSEFTPVSVSHKTTLPDAKSEIADVMERLNTEANGERRPFVTQEDLRILLADHRRLAGECTAQERNMADMTRTLGEAETELSAHKAMIDEIIHQLELSYGNLDVRIDADLTGTREVILGPIGATLTRAKAIREVDNG